MVDLKNAEHWTEEEFREAAELLNSSASPLWRGERVPGDREVIEALNRSVRANVHDYSAFE